MDLIVSHVNADFDALGSLIAARKLYPGARLLLPGSYEKSVRDLLALAQESVHVEGERECDLDSVDRLIVVDVRQSSRIGIAQRLIERGVEVHLYDHHTSVEGDIDADVQVSEAAGATVTILARIIKRRRIRLDPLEATIMLLGIYEETGSLTYRSTTKADVDMVSFLMSQGARVSFVSSYINRELSADERALLARLMGAGRRLVVKGVPVSVVEIAQDEYAGEIGMLMPKLMEIENLSVLFVVVHPKRGRTEIIGRSASPAVDVNRVLSAFGGGGHPGAASAKTDLADGDAVMKRLARALESSVKVAVTARDIMAPRFASVEISDTVTRASAVMKRLGTTDLPVMRKGRIAGVITLSGVNKALKTGYGHAPVKGYMRDEVHHVGPRAPLYAVRDLIVSKDAGIVRVAQGRKTIGIIHRSDVLRHIYFGPAERKAALQERTVVSLAKKIRQVFPPEVNRILASAGAAARARGMSAYIVGGIVRDLIAGRENCDLDIVIEGDAIAVASELRKGLGGHIVIHRRFGTCTLTTAGGLKIDFATARSETYERPGALPTVTFGPLKDDLGRRDFTINAMAVSLDRALYGRLIDLHDGRSDLERGRIRVMHDLSFFDDPTRIMRAVRFQQRFGFAIDAHTEHLIHRAAEGGALGLVQPQRLRDELVLVLSEDDPYGCLKRLDRLTGLGFIHHGLRLAEKDEPRFRRAGDALRWYGSVHPAGHPAEGWQVYLAVLLSRLDAHQASAALRRFAFRRIEEERITALLREQRRVASVLGRRAAVRPSRVYALLKPLSTEMVLALLALVGPGRAAKRIAEHLTAYRHVRLSVRGDHLVGLGLKPGPLYRKVLGEVLARKLDGRIKNEEEEVEAVRKLAGIS